MHAPQFLAQSSQEQLSAPAVADFSAFQPVLASLRQRFSDSPQSDPVKAAQAELGAVKDIMTQNVEQILSRGERIELLMDRTGEAANQSLAFRRRAKGLRRSMWWKNTKITALAGFCALVSRLPVLISQTPARHMLTPISCSESAGLPRLPLVSDPLRLPCRSHPSPRFISHPCPLGIPVHTPPCI